MLKKSWFSSAQIISHFTGTAFLLELNLQEICDSLIAFLYELKYTAGLFGNYLKLLLKAAETTLAGSL